MKVVIQRVKEASVSYEDIKNEIKQGVVVLVAFTNGDDEKKINYMIDKIINLRIFDDENGVMNKSVLDIKGQILSIPQFTLYGDCKKGRRPSYVDALEPKEAEKLYTEFNNSLHSKIKTKTGKFGAEMTVKIINEGPVTIIIER